jgi:uncharacterized lipoprotein YmbA
MSCRRALAGAVAALLLAACAAPAEHWYALEPTAPAAQSPPDRPLVGVGPVTVPEFVDRPQLVLREGEYRVNILEQERWAEPLKISLGRLFAGELTGRVADRRFISAPPAALGAPQARLAITVTRIDITRAGVDMAAHWVYRTADSARPPREGDGAVHEDARGPAYEDCVGATRRAAAALAGEMAATVTAP